MRVLLIGHPVAHSLSPRMQNAAFEAIGSAARYEAVDVPAENLGQVVHGLRSGEHLGANVTVPHKVAVVPMLDQVDDDVEEVGAVNTISVRDGRLVGHNTDIAGALAGLLRPFATRIGGASVCMLGAGGGARATVAALLRLEAPPRRVMVVTRRQESAGRVLAPARSAGIECDDHPWAALAAQAAHADVLVNATPLGLLGEDPLGGVSLTGKVVLDLVYRPGGTVLVRRARAGGAAAAQGDEMLLHQGARAFELWMQHAAPLEAMRAALASALVGR